VFPGKFIEWISNKFYEEMTIILTITR